VMLLFESQVETEKPAKNLWSRTNFRVAEKKSGCF